MSTRITSIIGSCALCAASAVWAATPVAVWDGDFSAESLSKNGWTLNLMGNALSADNSTITIDRDNNGVRLDADTAVDGVTVIVRYSGLAAGSYDRVLVTSNVDSGYDRTGIRLTTGGYLAGCGNGSTNSGTLSNYGSAAGSAPNSGYMAFVYKGGTDANARGTFIYFKTAGGTYPSNSSWGTYQLSYQADSVISGVTLGGMRQAVSGWEAAKGMNITGVAVFEGRVSAAELNEYSFPATDYPVTSDTSVSALNAALAGAGEVNLTVSPDVTITYDAAFSASAVRFTSSGNVRFAAKVPPSANEFAKLDMSGVQGSVIRTWLNPGVVGFNFNANGASWGTTYVDGAADTSGALADGEWLADASSANGSSTALFADGLTKISWSSANVYANGGNLQGQTFVQGYLDDGGSGASVTVSQIPYETYDVIIYASTDTANRKFSPKTVNGTTYTCGSDGIAVAGDSAWGASKNQTAVYGTNAMIVKGLSGALSINGGANTSYGGEAARGGIAAIQIMPSGTTSGVSEIVIDATEGYTTTDSDMLGSIRTTYRNVRILGDGSNGATLNFGYLNAASMYISSHIVFDGGTHAVTIDGSDNSTIGSNASQPILEVLNGTTLDFYQHDLSGWLGSAAAKVPTCNIQVDDGGQLNIRLDGAGTTYYQGRYTICPGATVTSYVTTSNGTASHLRFNGGAVEGAEQIYVPATTTSEPGVARFNGVEGNTGIFLASDETPGLGIFVGDNSILEFDLNIAGVAAAPLAKWGEGTVNFNGNLSGYAGTLTINEGTVNIGSETTLQNVVNNGTLTFTYGTTISAYSGAGNVVVDVSSLVDGGAVVSGSYTLLPGATVNPGNVEVTGLPEESGFSVHVTEDGIVLTDAFSPDWTGPSGSWTDGMFDGRTGSTDGKSVYFANSSGNDEVTVTVAGDKSVSNMVFLVDDTAYTLAPAADSSSSGITSTGNLTVSGLAPVRIETPLAVGGIALGAGTEFTFANESLTIPEGQLTGSGTFILDPGVGKTNTMAYANTSFTGEAVIKSGTVKMDDCYAFGPFNRANAVRVKGGAVLSTGCNNKNAQQGQTNFLILEDGATFTSHQTVNDLKLFPFSRVTLEGDANVVANDCNIGFTRHFNDPITLNFGEYTLEKSGANTMYIAAATINGTGKLKISEGKLNLNNGYDNVTNVFAEGTVEISSGATLNFDQYRSNNAALTTRNLVLDGAVTTTAADSDSVLKVTGYITGNGTTPMLTLAEGAVFKPTGTGYLTITESLNGTMTIDLSDIDMAHVMAVPLFKVGSVEMLPASSDLVFTASLPRGWKLAVTRDGCGYKLVKQAFDIRLR